MIEVVKKKKARIKHHQTLRLSKEYNSLEISYGVEFDVDNDEVSIAKGFVKAERIVEDRMARKHKSQKELLGDLSHGV